MCLRVPDDNPCYREICRNSGTFWTRQGHTQAIRGFVCGAATATETATKDGPMSTKIELLTSIASQDALHLAEQAVKRSSTTVKVDRQQLTNLLIDHGVCCATR